MARTHTFKGSASAGYGYFAYIEDGQLVIGEDWGRDGGILYRGPFSCKDVDHYLHMLQKNAPKLYNSIIQYYAKCEKFGISNASAKKEPYYVRYRFKDSRDSRGNGYSGYVNTDGLLIIEQDDPRGGGVRFEGRYEEASPVLAKLLLELRAHDPVLYDDIEKYFIKHGVKDESDKRATHSTGDERCTAVGYCSEGDPRQKAVGYYNDPSKKVNTNEDLKEKLGFDEATKTILFKVKLHKKNRVVHKVLVRGRFQADVIKKLMPPISEVLTLQTPSGDVFAIRSDEISAVEFVDEFSTGITFTED
jgi:hypothetical protein